MNNRELIVFYLYKDYAFLSSKDFQKRVKDLNIDTTKVYAEISKYQVNKYGKMLNDRIWYNYNRKRELTQSKQRKHKKYKRNQKERVWTESEFLGLRDE